jgi:DNA-binding NarL/FixJ family response regulator
MKPHLAPTCWGEAVKSLTEGEIELLRLVAEGMSNKAIAQTLSISENTAKYHVKNILQKLGVQNRTEAVTHAIRAELLAPDPSN